MTLPPLTRDECREVDLRAIAEYGLTGLVLMENAGRGCVNVLQSLSCQGPVAIVCGRGNNAGDGFVIARHLDALGIPTRVVLLAAAESLQGDAAANFDILRRAGLPCVELQGDDSGQALARELDGAEWVVDALLGTGASGPPRPPLDRAIRAMNGSAAMKLAVDLPSGLDCDAGAVAEPTFRADHTCTFVAPKVGFAMPAAQRVLGTLHVIDIGVPRKLLDEVGRLAAGRIAEAAHDR